MPLSVSFANQQPSQQVVADDDVFFRDIVKDSESGINYERTPSLREEIAETIRQNPPFIITQTPAFLPIKGRGAPGIAVFDYDNDGDEDIYVTNGPGTANSLYSNQHIETGATSFIDMANTAGVSLIEQDGNGVCVGDIDNDGDRDLVVLGAGQENRLFENLGDGSFKDISYSSNIAIDGDITYSSGCSMGDINGDGLIDIFIANTTDWNNMFAIIAVEPFALNQQNQLLLNNGDNSFTDVSVQSGITNLSVYPEGASGVTWAVTLIDYDKDGDLDIITLDDQATFPSAVQGGVDRGVIHVLANDGLGIFTDVSLSSGLGNPGDWMGLAFGDFNCDSNIDFFASNAGDYAPQLMVVGDYPLGAMASRWFLGQDNATFSDPGVGDLKSSHFGWGAVAEDFNNDGDTDILYHGGLGIANVIVNTPAVYLDNIDCSASFSTENPFLDSPNHNLRNVMGVASGDFNNDGFTDVVSVSNFNTDPGTLLLNYPVLWDSVYDEGANFVPAFLPTEIEGEYFWAGFSFPNGDLSIEINDGNSNEWIKVKLIGSSGLVTGGQVNRDGVGALVTFNNDRHAITQLKTVLAGSSYASQSSEQLIFGLGRVKTGFIDIKWPSGTKNRLYNVAAKESIVFPEIPCDYSDHSVEQSDYIICVKGALRELENEGVVSSEQKLRFFRSAVKAYNTTLQ